MEEIKYRIEQVEIKKIVESSINAQEMGNKDFNRLVRNLKKDKILTSSVLLMEQTGTDKLMCISGHHRIKAAKKAGIYIVPAIIINEVEESTRIRLQLTHNDIHGEPDEGILQILREKLQSIDIDLVESFERLENSGIEDYEMEDIEEFQYVSICLKPDSHEELKQMIGSHSVEAEEKLLIEAEDYNEMKKLLTLAFKAGFKTPGQAFRKFIDIVNESKLNEKE